MDAQDYLDAIKLTLAISAIVKKVNITQEWRTGNRGFFRARLWLQNGDFLEVAEFFTVNDDQVSVTEYRHQWMDSSRQYLRKRWDNAAHHPQLSNFPHHVHIGNENQIESGRSMSILSLINLLEHQIDTP